MSAIFAALPSVAVKNVRPVASETPVNVSRINFFIGYASSQVLTHHQENGGQQITGEEDCAPGICPS